MNGVERAEVWVIAALAALTLVTLGVAPQVVGWWLGLRIAAGVFLVLVTACMVVAARRGSRW